MRLEGWPRTTVMQAAILRDAMLRMAPQDEEWNRSPGATSAEAMLGRSDSGQAVRRAQQRSVWRRHAKMGGWRFAHLP